MASQPAISTSTTSVPVYTSKAISARVKSDPRIANLAFGEPDFGPPEHLAESIAKNLAYSAFLGAAKRYEESRGLEQLRVAISEWYLRRYGYRVDPDSEILITHGGVEAITLAILCTSDPGDTILVTDPTYMLYSRSVQTLARVAVPLSRSPDSEYLGALDVLHKSANTNFTRAKALIVNSPENPTGYVINRDEWQSLSLVADVHDLWIIHDEVYDTMSFTRPHLPARCVDGLKQRSILVNSFSKKFGLPGLRIGWLCATPELVSLAAKLHDYLYLGVNIMSEQVAVTLMNDPGADAWLVKQTTMLKERAAIVVDSLGPHNGFSWVRPPLGAMFAFPRIAGVRSQIPPNVLAKHAYLSDAAAEYFLDGRRVAVTPGSIYGCQGNESVRLVLCSPEPVLREAVGRLMTRHG